MRGAASFSLSGAELKGRQLRQEIIRRFIFFFFRGPLPLRRNGVDEELTFDDPFIPAH